MYIIYNRPTSAEYSVHIDKPKIEETKKSRKNNRNNRNTNKKTGNSESPS